MSKIFFRNLIHLFYPPHCPVCRKSLSRQDNSALCPECLSEIRKVPPPFCRRCGQPIPPVTGESEAVCLRCQKTNFYFEKARSAYWYEEILKECIHLFKYRRRLSLGGILGGLLVEFAGENLKFRGSQIVVPVPLHSLRLRERGFNQSLVLAERVAREFSLPLSSRNLFRRRPTLSQSRLGKDRRMKNVKDAFAVKNPEEFRKKSVLLIDDVFTTGATASECSRCLREHGADEVVVFTLARKEYPL